jgi:pimeloyl-ACP methyl ester carboxylesterase
MRLTSPIAAAGALAAVLLAGAWLYAPDKSRSELETRYARAPSRFIEVAGVRLHLRDTGPRSAPALILLHGFGDSLFTWQAWADRLEGDYRVVRLDLPGFGLTGRDPTGDYTDARSVVVILALLDTLGIKRASLIGNSMGGRIAWTFSALHPERVDKLVLISPDGFASPGTAYGRKASVPPLMRLLPYTLPAPLLKSNLAAAYGDPARLTPQTTRRTRDLLLAPGVRQAVVDRMGQTELVDPRPLLRRIEAATLLLWGEKDAFIPITNAQDYLAALPHARLVALPGLGHVPQEEAPAEALKPVAAFLRQ